LQKKQTSNYKKQTDGGGFFPLVGGEERNWVEERRLLPECDMITAQRITKWAQKFVLLLIFLTSQEEAIKIASK
jgi:hypothetical protein